MGRLFPLLALVDLAIMVIALIDCLSVEEFRIRALPRIAWVLLIILVSPVGGIAWFVAGRPERSVAPVANRNWRPGNGFPESARPVRDLPPDDDPEFLRRLASRERAEDEARLRAWEADLRRRERELRERDWPADRPEPDPPTD